VTEFETLIETQQHVKIDELEQLSCALAIIDVVHAFIIVIHSFLWRLCSSVVSSSTATSNGHPKL